MAYNPADFELVEAPAGSAPPYNPADFELVAEPEGSGFWRQALDLPVSALGGTVTGLKGMTDLFGANNPVSQELASYQQFYNQSLSPEGQADQQEVARIMQEAQDKGMWEQIKAGGRAFAVAPLDTAAQSLGTMAPIVATGLAGRAVGLGAKGVQAVQAGAGAGMNTGIVKDSIYQDTKNFLLQSGKSEEEADRVALEAQSYGGQNMDQLLLAAGIGAADALFGAEKILGNAISKTGKEVTGGVIVNALKTGVSEAIPEAAQGGQEAMAPNIALQREGYAVPTMRGVFAQGTMEGLAGFAAGAPVGAAEGMAPNMDDRNQPTMQVGQQPAPFTPPPAADTVEIQETFGDATTAAAETAQEQVAPASYNPDDFEVVEGPSETIVTEPPAAPRFQFDLADDTATAPEIDAEADVFAGVPQQQPSGPPAAPKIFRGVSPDVDYSSGDQFWSESREVAENYAAQTGTEGTIDEATPETLPKNLYTAADKPTLKDELELKSEPFAPEFDAEAKTVLQARGFEGIRYESGTDLGGEQAAEFHVFGKPQQQAAQQPALVPAPAAPAVESSFAQAFRAAKKTEDKRLAVMKAVADNSFLPAVIDAAESGKPLPNIEKFKDAFPYEGVTLPGRVDLSRVAIKPIKPAAPDIAARSHTAKDSSRFVLEGVYYDAEAQSVVGTDGRRLIAIPQKVEGKSRIISATDGREIQGQFPNWKYIIPNVDKDTILFNVDIDKARRAGTVLSGINKTLKPLVIPAKVKVGMATLDPAYVKDSVEALVASGAKKVYAASKDDASPVMLRGDNGAMAIIMPMRGGKNELVVDASTVIGEVIGNEGREVRQMFTDADPNAPAKKSRRRIKNMTAQSGAIDLSIVEDLVEYGKTIYRAGMSFGKWASEMVKEFGQGIASFLKQAFDRIVQAYKDSPYSDTTGAVGDVRPKAKPRQFEQKAAKAPGISEEARAQMGDDPYVPITLRGVAEQAKAWIGENGIEAAERRILGLADEGQTPTPLDFAIGLELTANLSATGNAGRAAAVVRTMSRRATSLGQTISTLAMLSRLTPEGIVFYANQIIEQHISSLTPERQAEIRAAQDDVANLEETVATTRKRTAEDAIINGTQGGEKIQDKLKRRIPDKVKKQDTNVSIRSVLTSQATKAEATKQITQILTESGISQSEATALATAITSRFYKVLEDARKALANSRKPAKGKGRVTIDKLLAQLKDGKITDEEFVSALAQVQGVPALTSADKARIQNLATQYKASTDDQVSLVLAARLFEEVHSIIPPDFWVKLRALSYLSMLFAPKTWIRNLGGNQIQWIANAGRDAVINMVVDPTMGLLTGRRTSAFGNTKRLRSLLTPFEDVIRGYKWNQQQNPSASFKDNAKAGIEHLRVLAKMTTQNKFEITDAKEVGRRIFSSRFMASWETALSIALGGGDRGFWMSAFTASLGQREAAAKKNGEWAGQPTPEDIEAAYADAMHAIYQNPNVISQSANRIRAALNRISTFGRTDQFGLGTALLAFTQVPGSITMRGLIEWSPLGMINALYEGMRPLLYKATNGKGGGNFRQEQFNKAFTQALLGSGGLFVGGYWLYALGVVTASREEDDDLEAMRRASGLGGYRVNLSALKRLFSTYTKQEPEDGDLIVSYDWAQPLAITFAAGAELAKQVEENDREGIKKGLAGKAGMAAISLAAGAKSLEEQPLLSGLSSFMKTWGYSGPLDAVVNTISGLPSMFVPQLVRQANQLMDNTVRETRGDEGMMRAFSRIAANTPGVADQFPPRMDIMGQAIERYQYAGNNVINVLVNPTMTSRVKTNPALQEVARLMQATGEASQMPRQVGRSVAINGENVNLSNEQISAYQYYLGNYTMSMFNWRMASPRYARMPDTEKVKLLSQDLEDVNAATKSALFGHDVNRLTRRQRVMRNNLVNSPLGQSMPPR